MATWSAYLIATPMAEGEAGALGYPATYGSTYSGSPVRLGIVQGTLSGAETQRPRHMLRATTSTLTADELARLDPTAGVWLDLHVMVGSRSVRRARLILSTVRVMETETDVVTDLEAVSVDALPVGEPPLYHVTDRRFGSVMTWLQWAQDQDYLFNTYEIANYGGTGGGMPQGWAPERGQTIDEILDEITAQDHQEWFGDLDGRIVSWPVPHTTAPRGSVYSIRPASSSYVSGWERSRSWDQWHNGALIRHRYNDGREVTWRVTQGTKESHPVWRFYTVDSDGERGGMVDTVAEELTRTSVRADTLAVTVPAHADLSTRIDVGSTVRTERPALDLDRRYVVAGLTLDLATGQTRFTLRGDYVRLARITAAAMPIAFQDVRIDDAQQIVNGELVPLED